MTDKQKQIRVRRFIQKIKRADDYDELVRASAANDVGAVIDLGEWFFVQVTEPVALLIMKRINQQRCC